MSYATKIDLDTRYGITEIVERSDRGGTGSADAVVVSAALSDADNEIDGYLSVQYELPLVPVPALVKQVACAIARYRLWEEGASDIVRKGYEDAIATLKRIAAGTMRLPSISGEPEGKPTAAPGCRVSVFTDATLAMMH